jgi:hypothetical protein
MQNAPHFNLPNIAQPVPMDIHDLLGVTIQLKEILAKETEQLKQMKIKELGLLQAEKLRLTRLLQSYQAFIAANPGALNGLDEEMREELALETEEFTRIVDENYRRVAVARAVNQRIVQAILDVITEQQHAGTYTKLGIASAPNMAMSFNLNQKA